MLICFEFDEYLRCSLLFMKNEIQCNKYEILKGPITIELAILIFDVLLFN